jgi:hypothetical protein
MALVAQDRSCTGPGVETASTKWVASADPCCGTRVLVAGLLLQAGQSLRFGQQQLAACDGKGSPAPVDMLTMRR